MVLRQRVDRVVTVEGLGLLARPDLDAGGRRQLAEADHPLDDAEHNRIDGPSVEGPGLGEQAVDPLGGEALERVAAGRGGVEDPLELRLRRRDRRRADDARDDGVAVGGEGGEAEGQPASRRPWR
jgi:hypothetical protein